MEEGILVLLECLFVYTGAIIRILFTKGFKRLNKNEINKIIKNNWISSFFLSVFFWVFAWVFIKYLVDFI